MAGGQTSEEFEFVRGDAEVGECARSLGEWGVRGLEQKERGDEGLEAGTKLGDDKEERSIARFLLRGERGDSALSFL